MTQNEKNEKEKVVPGLPGFRPQDSHDGYVPASEDLYGEHDCISSPKTQKAGKGLNPGDNGDGVNIGETRLPTASISSSDVSSNQAYTKKERERQLWSYAFWLSNLNARPSDGSDDKKPGA